MKKAWQDFINSFKPTYAVVVNLYHVIPGSPLNKKAHRVDFSRGAYDEAKGMYEQVVKKTGDVHIPLAEVMLVKGKKTVLQQQKFGPVEEVKLAIAG